MGDDQRQAFARRFEEDEEFRSKVRAATSIEHAVRICGEHGLKVGADDFAAPDDIELTDRDLEVSSGGDFPIATVTCVCTLVCQTSRIFPYCSG